MDTLKKCSKCGEVKPVSEFGKDKGAKDGLFRWCKVCNRNHQKEYRAKNPEKAKAATKRWSKAAGPNSCSCGRAATV